MEVRNQAVGGEYAANRRLITIVANGRCVTWCSARLRE
jgi:hypothetical protein